MPDDPEHLENKQWFDLIVLEWQARREGRPLLGARFQAFIDAIKKGEPAQNQLNPIQHEPQRVAPARVPPSASPGAPPRRLPFVAPVVYTIPFMGELQRRFPGYVQAFVPFSDFQSMKTGTNEQRSHQTRELEFEYIQAKQGETLVSTCLIDYTQRHLRPATLEELLAFDQSYPQEALHYPIVAIGSNVWIQGVQHNPVIGINVKGKMLTVMSINHPWDDANLVFLAVREIPLSNNVPTVR